MPYLTAGDCSAWGRVRRTLLAAVRHPGRTTGRALVRPAGGAVAQEPMAASVPEAMLPTMPSTNRTAVTIQAIFLFWS